MSALPDASRVAFEAWMDGTDFLNYLECWQESRKQALEEAVQACGDAEEPSLTGYECPNTFNDGKCAAEAAIKELLK